MIGKIIYRYTTAKVLPNDLYKKLNDFHLKRKTYPLDFSETAQQQKYSYFKKLLINKQIAKLFQSLVQLCQIQTNPNEFLQPKLVQQLLFQLKSKNTKIKVNKLNILKTVQIFSTQIKGAFIHRDLNLPKECYSFQKDQKNVIRYRPKVKFTRSNNISLFRNRQSFYEENQLNLIYGDSYENVIDEGKIKQQIYEVDCQLQVEIHSFDQAPICYGKNTITKHYLQVETIINPSQQNYPYLTDIDFSLQGNNFVC